MSRILATYRIRAAQGDIRARAEALAAEQSVEMPIEAIEDPKIRAEIVARVESIAPDADAFAVTIGIAAATTGNEPSQLLNMLFGNCSLQPEVELLDAVFPDGYANAFRGPAFGIEGIRAATGVRGRALTCTALKPQGLTTDALASLARTFALAGIDVIKDDHGLANQAYSPFAQRVPAVQGAIEAANRESGGATVYAPTFSGSARLLAEQARTARDHGVKLALVAPMLVGVPALAELRSSLGLPIIAHPALGGATRIAPPLLLGKLFRLFGADATIFPNYGGRFGYTRETCLAIAAAARAPWPSVKPVLPVPAGGMTLERVPEMVATYGIDTMILIGGALLEAGPALLERSRAFSETVR